MNNQAAQTMPEHVADALNVVNEAANRERHAGNYDHANSLVRARVTLAKFALSQTAGVAEGFVMVPIVPTDAMKAAGAACFPNRWGNGDATDGEDAADCYREMLSAASGEKGVG